MSMYEFEVACKNIIIEFAQREFGEKFCIKDIHVVWMCKTIGNKKAIMIDSGKNNRMYEITCNGAKNECYFDVYQKVHKECITNMNTAVVL